MRQALLSSHGSEMIVGREVPDNRRPRRITTGAYVWSLLLGLLCAAAQPGCSADDRYQCTSKILRCHHEPDEAACTAKPTCAWVPGCVRACVHDPNPQEECIAYCQDARGAIPETAEACAPIPGCAWEPGCFENEELPCTKDLDETECRRRSCRWENVSPGTTL